MESICILCKRNLDGSSLERHVKEVHLIGHEGALNLLLDYLRRETGCQVEEFELVRQNYNNLQDKRERERFNVPAR